DRGHRPALAARLVRGAVGDLDRPPRADPHGHRAVVLEPRVLGGDPRPRADLERVRGHGV
ncbi:MAG: hypothetical protein AVDCRST_MAG30-201, partial [uncultured Solirubrobacteraceae bacterium]